MGPVTRDEQRPASPSGATRFIWLELIRGLAFAWIFLNHIAERVFGYPYIANPGSDWVPLAQRIAQLRPLHGHGLWDIPLNLTRWVGWAGDQGVNLFLIASGFGLTWGLLCQGGTAALDVRRFYVTRAARIYPPWWAAHLAFLAASVLLGYGALLTDPAFYLSLAGIRATPQLFYYLAPAWWYIGLLLQLYLVYPLIWAALRTYGPGWVLIIGAGGGCLVRGAGLLLLDSGVDPWARGALFVTRLPEFVVGVSLAACLHHAPAHTGAQLRRPTTVVLALLLYTVGTLASLSLVGMTVAPLFLGSGAFVLLYAALHRAVPHATIRPWLWMGRHSYALFLVHHPLILALVPNDTSNSSAARIVARVVVSAWLTVLGAVALESAVTAATQLRRRGLGKARRPVVAGGLAVLVLLVGAELLVRARDPQEVQGWGERASLEPDATFGWRLRPSQHTRLRWESYDYEVTANRLGFPGPEYAVEKTPGTLRILTTGDAFTSAEGVDTDRAWPRLLEADLTARLAPRRVEVLNFAITGYGPNQYAAVVAKFAPVYRPDLIVIGLFVNDFEDVLMNDDAFRASIGFELGPQAGWRSVIRLSHLRQWLKLHPIEWAYELLRGQPGPHGYFLGQFAALERDRPEVRKGAELVRQRLRTIARDASAVGATVVIAMIPAPVQVCDATALAYYPHHVDLTNAARFDRDQPQRLARQIADELHIDFLDLRPALAAAPGGCPYQARNLHWTTAGHQLVAQSVATWLTASGQLH